MYFSKITLQTNIPRQELIKVINQGEYKQHQILWRLFRDSEDTQQTRSFIYRYDLEKTLPYFYAVSQNKPKENIDCWAVESKIYEPKIPLAQEFTFILRVNPRIAKIIPNSKKHYYCDAIMDAYKKQNASIISKQQIIQDVGNAWLNTRAPKYGFSIKSMFVEFYEQHRLFKKGYKDICFSTLDYRGKLRVENPELFLQTLYNGIGAAKGFGCGLLMIKR